jgi:hypothetical protein
MRKVATIGGGMRRWQRWLGAGAIVLGLQWGALPSAALVSGRQISVVPDDGVVLYVSRGDLWSYRVADRRHQLFLHLADGVVTHVAHAPDHRRFAFSATYYDRSNNVRASEIVLCDPPCESPEIAVHEEEPGFRVGWASWPSDPGRLVYAKVDLTRGIERVEEVELATGLRSLVLEFGSAPAASPTAPTVVYQTRVGQHWDVRAVDRATGARTELVQADWFLDADHPVFSPDGGSVAFVAAGDGPASGDPVGPVRLLADLFDLGRVRVAAAHDLVGVVFDLWVMQSGGEGLHRVAPLLDLQPEITWSPSGRQLAALGSLQLQIVDLATGETQPAPRPPVSSPRGSPLSWGAGNQRNE